jgi:hypothetical protein
MLRIKLINNILLMKCNAAYKLAAALGNYDKDDLMTLNFIDVKAKE